MTTGYTALQDLKECPVCKEELEFTDPRALPCDHLLCKGCIDRIKRRNQIKCPVCNAVHKVSQVRRDYRLIQFLDALKEEKGRKQNQQKGDEPYCQVCSLEDAHHWCKDCKKWMCSGCKRSHPNIPACKNHKAVPLSSKKQEIKSKYQSTAKKIQGKKQNCESAATNIDCKIDDLEMTQIEALAESNEIRSKCIEDINKYFDKIDDEITIFIQDRISKLKDSRNDLFSELHELETKLSQLEYMINNDSRKLVVDGQAILDQANQISDSFSDCKFKNDKIVIKVERGPDWEPSSAVILQMGGNQMTLSSKATGAYQKLSTPLSLYSSSSSSTTFSWGP